MESSEDVEVLSRAIENLLDEKTKREAAGDSFIDDDQLLLSKLISQLETPNPFQKKTAETTKEEEEEESSPDSKGKREGQQKRQLEKSIEEIAKDIKEVKKQNKVTHILLSAFFCARAVAR